MYCTCTLCLVGGGCSRELAKWIVHGATDLDMFAFDIRYEYFGRVSVSNISVSVT